MLLSFGICIYAQKGKVNNSKPTEQQNDDTVLVVIPLDSVLIPFEPYESNYKTALKNARSTKERVNVFKTYFDALYSSSLNDEQKQVLLKSKIKEYINIDFYSLYEFQLLVAKERENAKPLYFIRTFRKTATEQQQRAITEYMKYVVGSANVMVHNQTTEQTAQQPRPSNWPDGLPFPGYGWGKFQSSDDVAVPVSMQYHLSEDERYNIISQYKKESKKISPDDQAWYTEYGYKKATQKNTNQANNLNSESQMDRKLLNLVGKYFDYNSEDKLKCTICKVIDAMNKDVIILKCKYGVYKQASYDELFNNKGVPGYRYVNWVSNKCRVCNGKGVFISTYKHTNDYEYTLGAKITYTSRSVSTCNACGGSGIKDIID